MSNLPAPVADRLQALSAQTDQLLRQVAAVSPEQRLHKPAPDVWSPLEVLYHVYAAERASLRSVERFVRSGKRALPESFASKMRVVKLLLGNTLPIRLKAPALVAKMPDVLSLEALQTNWTSLRTELRQFLETLPPELYGQTIFRHPFVGDITPEGMVYFFQLHMARHTKQIRRRLSETP